MNLSNSLKAGELTSVTVTYYNFVIVTENHLHSILTAILRVNV